MRNALTAVFSVFTTAFLAVGLSLAVPAGAAPKPDDCRLVAKADRTLCQQVRQQTAYAYVTRGGNLVYVPDGRTLVREEVTHAGLTKAEMRSYLRGYVRSYARHAVNTRSVTVDLSSLRRAYGTDAQYTVGFSDRDGKRGGQKDNRVELDLP